MRRRRRLSSSGSAAEVGPASVTVVIGEHLPDEVVVVETEEVVEAVEVSDGPVIDGPGFAERLGESPLEPGGGPDGGRGGGKPLKPGVIPPAPLPPPTPPPEHRIASTQPVPTHRGSPQVQNGAGIIVGCPL